MTITKTVELTEGCCAVCGIDYAVPKDWLQQKINDKGEFYCPNGHCRVFTNESHYEKEQRLEREKLQIEERAKRLQSDNNILRNEIENEKRKLEKLNIRINNGVCPHCNRTFQNLKRHIQCKHESNPDSNVSKTKPKQPSQKEKPTV